VTEQADFVVIGGGIAGLRAMATLAGAGRTVLLTKAGPAESNTGYAQGGIAAAIGPGDSPELHLADTLKAGAGLCDRAAVEVLVNEGPDYVRELLAWGARFDRDANGAPALAREGAHSVHRVLHAHDTTGREIARTLWQHVAPASNATILHDAQAVALQMEDGTCAGVRYVDSAGRPGRVRARAVLLATGGAGRVFADDQSPDCHGRWRGHGLSRRSPGQRSRIRPVPPDRPRRADGTAVSVVGGSSGRGGAPRQR
jgi:L-aspartate oxidase